MQIVTLSGLSQQDKIRLVSRNAEVAESAAQTGKKLNILVIWGNDIGVHNISVYNHWKMGYLRWFANNM